MATRLALRIQDGFEGLTPSERKLALLLLDQPDGILTFSATELAGLAGVSKATAARFFRNLGYADFNDVRLQAREERNLTGPVQQVVMPDTPPAGAATVPIHLQVEIANLTRTFEAQRSDLLAGVAERLATAHRVWVAGLGAENGLARHARIHLARIRPSVHEISENTGTWAEELASTGPQDALIVVAIRPWPAVVEAILDFARTTRLETIVVTDPTNASRVRRHGAMPLICQVTMPGCGASHTTVLSMLHLVVNATAGRLGPLAGRRQELIMDLREELDPAD